MTPHAPAPTTPFVRVRRTWKDESLGAFIRLRCNVEASRAAAPRLVRATATLLDLSRAWGAPVDPLRAALDDFLLVALRARAGRDVMPELIGAELVAVFDALTRAQAHLSPDQRAWLRHGEAAIVETLADVARRHAPVAFEAYWHAKATAAAA